MQTRFSILYALKGSSSIIALENHIAYIGNWAALISRQTDRQTDRQTHRQTNRETDRQTHRKTERSKERMNEGRKECKKKK